MANDSKSDVCNGVNEEALFDRQDGLRESESESESSMVDDIRITDQLMDHLV